MELVYLWVEDYKNIHKQGFNFSPRFKCEYKNEILTIDENKDYVSIFPENINITAIVGENGSGKSSIYELLFNLIHNVEIQNSKAFLVTYSEKVKKYSCSDSNVTLINNEKMNLEKDKNFFLLLDFIYSPWNIDNLKDVDNYKKNYSLEPSRILFNPSLRNKMDINGFDSNIKNFGFYGCMYLINNHIKNDFSDKLKNIKIDKRPDDIINRLKECIRLVENNYNFCNSIINNLDIKDKILNNLNKTIILINQNNTKENREKYYADSFLKIIDDEIIKLEYKKIETLCIEKDFYLLFSLYNFDILFDNNFKFKNLSSGQRTLLAYIGYIIRYIKHCKNTKKESLTIIIDECETSLHPNWQKQTVKFFLDSVKNEALKDFKINFIFISHSPFILSDIPRKNIIF